MNAKSDQELWLEFINGSHVALGELYARHYRGLFMYCWAELKDDESVSDLIQDMFLELQVIASEGKLDYEGENIRSWLFVFAKNRAKSKARIEANRSRIRREIISKQTQKECRADSSLDVQPIYDSIAEMSNPDDVKILTMTLEGYNNEEISKALNKSLKQVVSRKFRARKKLKKRIRIKNYLPSILK